MGTETTDSVHPISLAPGGCQVLTAALQPHLASGFPLTLVLLGASIPSEETADAARTVKLAMDEIEQLLIACLRRADVVLRCGERSCAAILYGAEAEGALRAVDRFRKLLGSLLGLAHPLWVGLASAPCEAVEAEALIALAWKPRLHLLPASGDEAGNMPALVENDEDTAPEGLPAKAGARRAARSALPLAPAQPASNLPGVEIPPGAALGAPNAGGGAQPAEALARARARALGVPYLKPPRHIPSSVRNLLPPEVMRQLRCLPVGRDRNALTVALADPTDRGILHRLEEITGLAIFPVMTDPDALEALARPAHSRRNGQMAAVSSSAR